MVFDLSSNLILFFQIKKPENEGLGRRYWLNLQRFRSRVGAPESKIMLLGSTEEGKKKKKLSFCRQKGVCQKENKANEKALNTVLSISMQTYSQKNK